MTLPIWPPELPRPTRSGYGAQLQDSRLKKSADSGPPGHRRRFSSVARMVSLEIDVPRSLKAVFDRFHQETTAYGSLPFTMPDPTTDGWPLLSSDGRPMLTPTGQPILLSKQWLCLFGDDMPRERTRGVRFQISFSISVLP